MKNELFIQTRRTHKSQPSTTASADCELRHYPKGAGSDAKCNSIAIDVTDREGVTREKELINIQFVDGYLWSGDFEKLRAAFVTLHHKERIDKMVASWKEHGRAFSHVAYMEFDGDFFLKIGVPSNNVGITSQTSHDCLYYDTSRFGSDNAAIKNIPLKQEPADSRDPETKVFSAMQGGSD